VKPSAEDDPTEKWREFQQRAKAAPVRVGNRGSVKAYVEANADSIGELKSKGYRYVDVAEILNGVGIAITAKTLEYYYGEARRKRAARSAKPGSKPGSKPSSKPYSKPSESAPKSVLESERGVSGEARANHSAGANAALSKDQIMPSNRAGLEEPAPKAISRQIEKPAEQSSGKLADAMRYMGEDEA
jgi:hypothetical protein